MEIKGTIYTTNRKSFVESAIPEIVKHIKLAKGVKVREFTIAEIKLPKDVPTVIRERGGISYVDIDWGWFKKTFPANGSVSCLHLSRADRDRIGLTHSNGKSKLGGRYSRNIGDTSMEFIVIANYIKDFSRLFLHELSHGFAHWTKVYDLTHTFEATGGFIGNLYSTYDFTVWKELTETVKKLTVQYNRLLEKPKPATTMQNPEYLITHHGADARLLTVDEMRQIYQDTHYESLYKKYDQPRSAGPFPDIAYHVLVGSDGWGYARSLIVPGYHASNYPVNLNSIAICISGHYDRQQLTPVMERYYREAVAELRTKVPSLKYVNGHRAYSSKTCPGGTITDEFIKEVFESAAQPGNVQRAKAHLAEALASIQKAINEL